jgi:hypothetical protein
MGSKYASSSVFVPADTTIDPDDVDPDFAQIERAFRRITAPHTRYFLAQMVELVADGMEINLAKAQSAAARFAKNRNATKEAFASQSTVKSNVAE